MALTDDERMKIFLSQTVAALANRGLAHDENSFNFQLMEIIGSGVIELLNAEDRDRGFQ